MSTFHLHINGRVQGVGFRPHVYRKAKSQGITGIVRNDTDGVHVIFNAGSTSNARTFAKSIINEVPDVAVITGSHLKKVAPRPFDSFSIAPSANTPAVNLRITPDFAICSDCRRELFEKDNRRFKYPFITCTSCGPRYSIIESIPYDRHRTTMGAFSMCTDCRAEYDNPDNSRYYSQTNSCPQCPVSMALYNSHCKIINSNQDEIIELIVQALADSKIIAVKGIGGYVLMCAGTDRDAIQTLRGRKNRPAKPFAVMYPSEKELRGDLVVEKHQVETLKSPASPIMLLRLRESASSGLDHKCIAPGLGSIGAVLPYTGLFEIILNAFRRPVVFTSGNISDAPIIYQNPIALEELTEIAELVVTNDRDIVIPQDDSVIRPSMSSGNITIRRSRGIAPSIEYQRFENCSRTVLALGADLKGTFGIHAHQQTYVSQYLGDLSSLGAQESFRHSLAHLLDLLKAKPGVILSDLHPGYYSAQLAASMASEGSIPLYRIQHHKAHFAAVLAENDLMKADEPILGVVFDGTGFGEDGQVWGGEFFKYEDREITRVGHLPLYDHFASDKMSREPRLSAFALFNSLPMARDLLRKKFSDTEWNVYTSLLPSEIKTSSAGRIFDAVASVLGLCDVQSYEGEAAMYLEHIADEYARSHAAQVSFDAVRFYPDGTIDMKPLFDEIVNDVATGVEKGLTALKFHHAIALSVIRFAEVQGIRNLALSGGVFQNSLLADLCHQYATEDMIIYTHCELSPNDENISYGQLAFWYMKEYVQRHKTIEHVLSNSG